MSRIVFVSCPTCGERARITSSREASATVKQLYCQCHDPLCGHTFVVDMQFSRTLSPSAKALPDELKEKLAVTPPTQQHTLFA